MYYYPNYKFIIKFTNFNKVEFSKFKLFALNECLKEKSINYDKTYIDSFIYKFEGLDDLKCIKEYLNLNNTLFQVYNKDGKLVNIYTYDFDGTTIVNKIKILRVKDKVTFLFKKEQLEKLNKEVKKVKLVLVSTTIVKEKINFFPKMLKEEESLSSEDKLN